MQARRRSTSGSSTELKRAFSTTPWWKHNHETSSTEPVQSVAYADLGPTYVSEDSPQSRILTSASSTETSPAATAVASHLTYRDNPGVPPHNTVIQPQNSDPEAVALRQAIEASRAEQADDEKRRLEADELRSALAESVRLARARQPTSPTSQQEQAELSQALLASQRQALLESQARSAASRVSRSGPSGDGTVHAAPAYDASDLARSEQLLLARNEKGSLFAEAGAHGWLPPGAARPGRGRYGDSDNDDEHEYEMLELAIRLSLAEEEERERSEARARQDAINAALESVEEAKRSSRPALSSDISDENRLESFRTARTSTSIDQSSPHHFVDNAPPKPQRAPPPLPPSNREMSHPSISGPPPLPPYPPNATRYPSSEEPSSTLSPTSSRTAHRQEEENGRVSPYEMPYLVSSPSISSRDPVWSAPASASGNEHSESSGHTSSVSRSTRSLGSTGDHQQLIPGESHNSFEEHRPELTIRNPDQEESPAPHVPAIAEEYGDSTPSLPLLESSMAGRSLSLVTEATEPEEHEMVGASPVSPDTIASIPVAPLAPEPLAQAAAVAIARAPDNATAEARFGYAHEDIGQGDGLASGGLFPGKIELSLEGETKQPSYSIEAGSWVGLLRFLMWFGDTVMFASAADVAAHPSHRCDMALSLSFGQSQAQIDDQRNDFMPVIRLTATLLHPHEASHDPTELTVQVPTLQTTNASRTQRVLGSSSSGGVNKGKGKASGPTSRPPASFLLPDHVVLPTRLSSIAVSLYSLRHLALIAQSTQPAKTASPSYHALRLLAEQIQALSRDSAAQRAVVAERRKTGNTQEDSRLGVAGSSGGRTGVREHDDLVGRLRERLRRMRGASSAQGSHGRVQSNVETTGPSTAPRGFVAAMREVDSAGSRRGNGGDSGASATAPAARLVKASPPSKTTAVNRRHRVLTQADEGNRAQPDSGGAAAAAAVTASETRWLPELQRQ